MSQKNYFILHIFRPEKYRYHLPKDLNKNVCDKLLFSKLYEKYAQGLSDILYYKYGALLNPSDKVQDAFIKMWQNCSKVTTQTAKSYLYTVANNMMLNDVKHQKVVLNYNKVKPKDYNYETPEFLMRKEQFLVRYETVLSNLKPEQREAFILSKIEGKTHQEIADMIGVTKKVVGHRIYAAFAVLTEQLEDFKLK
jgi:RNA polymerase sigma-70 factor (ECF subfamily)